MEQHKNYKTFEEAKAIWNSRVRHFDGDQVAFYVVTPDKEDELIGIEKEEDMKLETSFEIVAVGTGKNSEHVKAGDRVIPKPQGMNVVYPVFIDDCGFMVLPTSYIAVVLN